MSGIDNLNPSDEDREGEVIGSYYLESIDGFGLRKYSKKC